MISTWPMLADFSVKKTLPGMMDLTDSAYSPPRGSYTVELDLTVDQISCWRSFFDLKKLGVRRMGPSSFQWCPVTGQGAMGTN